MASLQFDGMTHKLLKEGTSLAKECCCEVVNECNACTSHIPDYLQLTLSGMQGACDYLNGVYILHWISYCNWVYGTMNVNWLQITWGGIGIGWTGSCNFGCPEGCDCNWGGPKTPCDPSGSYGWISCDYCSGADNSGSTFVIT